MRVCVILFSIVLLFVVEGRTRRRERKARKQMTRENSSKCYWTSQKVVKPIHIHIHSDADTLTYWTMQRKTRHTRLSFTMWHAVHVCLSDVSLEPYVCVCAFFFGKETIFFFGKVHHSQFIVARQMYLKYYIVISISLWLSGMSYVCAFFCLLFWNCGMEFQCEFRLKIKFEIQMIAN